MVDSRIFLVMLFAIPTIAIFDYLLFRKYLKCEKCGYCNENPLHFLVPVVIENVFFLAGIAVGVLIWG